MENKKNTILRGIFSCEVADKVGDVVLIDGMEISALQGGKGLVNSEHDSSFAKTVGRVLNAKKIFKQSDCTNDFEKRSFRDSNELPILVGTIELFDGEGHEEAQAIGKIVKYFHNKKEPVLLGLSVEGGILERSGNTVKKSIVRKIALTATPCNEAAKVELVSELTKSERTVLDRLSKAKTENILSVGKVIEVQEYDVKTINQHIDAFKDRLEKITKALEAGFATGAPGTLTQGAALQKVGQKATEESTEGTHEESTKLDAKGNKKVKKEKPSDEGLKPIDEAKVDKIDEKKEEATLNFKLKKAELIAYSFFNSLKK